MHNKSIHILLMISTLLLFTGCTTSSLTYTKETLNLKVDNTQLQVHGTQLKSRSDNFSILFLDQKLIRLDDGTLVMYEKAETDIQYEFANTTTRTIQVVFDAKRLIKVYDHALVYAYQLVLADNRILNILISQSYDQELSMVYGMSTQKLDKMLHKLNPNTAPAYYKNAITLNLDRNPLLSNWTTWKVNFVPLVQPLPRLMRM